MQKDKADEEKSKEEEPIKKKGNVSITKTTKSSTTVFTKRTRRKKLKLGEEAKDIFFQMDSTYISREIKRDRFQRWHGKFQIIKV